MIFNGRSSTLPNVFTDFQMHNTDHHDNQNRSRCSRDMSVAWDKFASRCNLVGRNCLREKVQRVNQTNEIFLMMASKKSSTVCLTQFLRCLTLAAPTLKVTREFHLSWIFIKNFYLWKASPQCWLERWEKDNPERHQYDTFSDWDTCCTWMGIKEVRGGDQGHNVGGASYGHGVPTPF